MSSSDAHDEAQDAKGQRKSWKNHNEKWEREQLCGFIRTDIIIVEISNSHI